MRNNNYINSNKKTFFIVVKFILLILIGAFFIYRLNSPLANFIFYSFIFYRFIYSNNIIFWTAFLFILLNSPWGLFYYRPYEWYISLTPTVGISYLAMIGVVFMIKAHFFLKKNKFVLKDYFSSFYKPLGIFIIFLIIWSFAFGHSVVSIFNIIQYGTPFLLFFIVPILFNSFELLNFNKIIFLFSLFHFGGSAIEIIMPGSFMPMLFFGPPPTGISYSDDLIRFVGGITIHFYAMSIGLYYVTNKIKYFKNWYLWLVILLSYIFIINSATRGWMISSSFLIFGYFIYNAFKINISIRTIVSFIIIIIILALFIPNSFIRNIDAAFTRLETVEAIAAGDVTADGSLSRLTERGPRVLSKFSESPIFGFGYSKISAEYFDGHVGNHNLLLMGGVIGFAIIWLTILFVVFYFFRLDVRFPSNGFFVFGLSIIAIMIIHSSSRSMVSYYMPADSAFLIALLFNHINAAIRVYPKYSE